jgi:hypothetical protein
MVGSAAASRAPDFFLVGAPKAATSSLHALLIRHPGIFMCRPKEPHFFSTDLPGLSEAADRRAYDDLFRDAPPDALRGEASAHYLFSAHAAAGIRQANPEARIILSLRNPADAARSYYHQLRDGFREDRTSFEEAWTLQEARAAGRALPPYCPEPRQLQYRAIYSYAEQVARYLDLFPRDQILILHFEEIAKAPGDVVRRVLEFLGLPDFPEPVELPRKNTRRVPRFPRLAQAIAAPPPVLRPLVAPVKRVFNAMGIKPSVVMMNRLSRPAAAAPQPPPDPRFRTELLAAFADDIDRLEPMIGADLSGWRR